MNIVSVSTLAKRENEDSGHINRYHKSVVMMDRSEPLCNQHEFISPSFLASAILTTLNVKLMGIFSVSCLYVQK